MTGRREASGTRDRGTLVDVLRRRAEQTPETRVYTFLRDGELDAQHLTYGELDTRARAIAGTLQHWRGRRERSLLLYPPGPDYVAAFFGCLYAGVIAVPAPRLGRIARIRTIVDDARPAFVLSTDEVRAARPDGAADDAGLATARWLTTDDIGGGARAEEWRDGPRDASDLAFLQYTSGSTSVPKGVMVTHANLTANLGEMRDALGLGKHSVGVSWLPPYHDMGLIGAILMPLYCGFPAVMMAPLAFLRRPARWLEAITRYEATISAGPNAAYQLCVDKISDEELAGLRLDTWKQTINGAEPVRLDVIERFCERFAEAGFKRRVFLPSYGLAEATLFVSGRPTRGEPREWHVDSEALREGHARDGQPGAATQALVGSGALAAGVELAIVDPDARTRCEDGRVGEIWLAGASVAAGYWENSETSAVTFDARLADCGEGPFLRTGDLGVVHDGELFVTGRLRDMMIFRGRNYYPQDVERSVERCHPAMASDRGAAFSVEIDGEERLVVVHEAPPQRDGEPQHDAIVGAIRRAIAEDHELQPSAVVLIRARSIPRTSSGKIQRRATRDAYLDGSLELVSEWTSPRAPSPPATTAAVAVVAPAARDVAAIEHWLREQIAARLGIDVELVDVAEPFSYYGLDSIEAVVIAGELERWLGQAISPTIAWDYPTIAAAAGYLVTGAPAGAPSTSPLPVAATDAVDPIAVVGMACRMPGSVDGPDALWELLCRGGDAIGELPSDRWDVDALWDPDPDASGKAYSRHAGVVDDATGFDAAFFGISGREAAHMDPQQRLLLEVAWEALERGGIAPDSLAGSRTGAFVGISTTDHALMQYADGVVDRYSGTGNAHSIAANRLSYVLGLVGPSLAVDTACSSSLVAVHLACQSLRSGESDLALAAGVNLLLTPETTMSFCRARMLSPSGRCQAFDAGADGYVRGEGCGVVVLKRLSAAVEAGDEVLAVIRGSAVNQDGRSNGLTAPHGPSQESVIARALEVAGVAPEEVGYVEAHGTGTPLGDPIELRALSRALGGGRRGDDALWVGSLKTNVGHLEAAAGVAALIKTVLVVSHGEIPEHLHLREPTPHVDWQHSGLRVPTALTSFPPGPRIAGVSSFGFGGTNAHVVLGQAPAHVAPSRAEQVGEAAGGNAGEAAAGPAGEDSAGEPSEADDEKLVVVKLAARGATALTASAQRLAAFVEQRKDVGLGEIAHRCATQRADLADRAAIVAGDRAELLAGLDALATGTRSRLLRTGRAGSGGRPQVAFLVAGQGARYGGSARELVRREPVAARMIDALSEVLGPRDALPLAALLEPGEESDAALARTDVAQPASYALALALGAWWGDAGVGADVIVGHSVGAYAAAALAGALDLRDGARLVAARGRLMATLPAGGAMAAVFAGADAVAGVVKDHPGAIAVAAINSPSETVLSGRAEVLRTALDDLLATGIKSRLLTVSHAFHSPLIEPILGQLADELTATAFTTPHTALICDTTGAALEEDVGDPARWVAHARRTVDFVAALRAVAARRCRLVVELGPDSALLAHARRTLEPGSHLALGSLDPRIPASRKLRGSLAHAWTSGAPIDWRVASPPAPTTRRAALPTYPFQHRPQPLSATARPIPPSPMRIAPPRTDGAEFATAQAEPAATREGAHAVLAAILDAPPAEKRAVLLGYLRAEVGRVIQLDPSDPIDLDQGFFELGLDSLMAADLHAALQADLERELPVTLAMDHPTLNALVDHLLALVLGHATPCRPAPRRRTDAGPAEPIAIVGMACRFPGGSNDLDAYWRMLHDGIDGIGLIPPDRWDADAFYDSDPDAPLRMSTRHGGFLNVPVDGFDAEMFGISPREADAMDPQQRLLLEVAWEALEDAGVRTDELAGTPAGVYLGINTSDYMQLLSASGGAGVDAYTATGNTFSIAAGRLSYLLGLQGPSIAIDTACSSSLVALHLACDSLRTGESAAALVGGVNLMLSPATTVGMTKLRALAPDGRCKTFDAAADGYGRGEGCGVVVVKRLSDATAAGDRIYALVRGSAVNQDGRSAGLTVPSGPSQQALIRTALAHAGVEPQAVSYVEAHGTGTPLGDPIELQAVGAVLGEGRDPGSRVVVGSVKTNIGHLEAAAGVAGVIKVALALHRGRIPAHLHLRRPSERIPWHTLPLAVAAHTQDWPACAGPRIAGVSSFGFSGTNAHAILEQAPLASDTAAGNEAATRDRAAGADDAPPGTSTGSDTDLLLLSARSDGALHELAGAYRDVLRATTQPGDARRFGDVCRAAATRRAHHGRRLAIAATSTEDAAARLDDYLAGDASARVAYGCAAAGDTRRLVFVFSGQGGQFEGMGRGLLAGEPAFREAVDRCDELVRAYAGWSLLAELQRDVPGGRPDDAEIAQPLFFAIQVGLAALWRSWSIVPDVIVGHSAGEVAAAHVAGVLGLEDAVRVIVERGRAMRPAKGLGRMVAVGLSRERAELLLAGAPGEVGVAAVNGPAMTTLAGEPAAIEHVIAAAAERQALCRPVATQYPGHCSLMRPFQARLVAALGSLTVHGAAVPVVSAMTARLPREGDFDARHWGANIVRSVRFADALRVATGDGQNLVVELSPHPVLTGAITQSLEGLAREGVALASMRRDDDQRATALAALGALHARGHEIRHEARYRGRAVHVSLPTYRWQRRRHWLEHAVAGTDPDRSAPHRRPRLGDFTLLQRRLVSPRPTGEQYFEADLDLSALPYVEDLRVAGLRLVPPSLCIEFALAAAQLMMPAATHVVRDLRLHDGELLGEEHALLQLVMTPGEAGGAQFEVYARAGGDGAPAVAQASGTVSAAPPRECDAVPHSIAGLRASLQEVPAASFAEALAAREVVLGDGLATVARMWRGERRMLAVLELPGSGADGRSAADPALLEPLLHAVAAIAEPAPGETTLVVGEIGSLALDGPLPSPLWVSASLPAQSRGGRLTGELRAYDDGGKLVAEILDARLRPLGELTRGRARDRRLDELAYELEWHPTPRPAPPSPRAQRPPRASGKTGTWIVLADVGGVAPALVAALEQRGDHCCVVAPAESPPKGRNGTRALDPASPQQARELVAQLTSAGSPPLRGLIHLWGLREPAHGSPSIEQLRRCTEVDCGGLLHLVQALAGAALDEPPAVWLATRGVQPVLADGLARPPLHAPLWGLGRVVALEHPELWGGMIDLDEDADPAAAAAALLRDIVDAGGEDQLAYRGGERFAARLVRSAIPPAADVQQLRDDASYLVTGGRGSLGLKLAAWLAERGARSLVLAGRTPLPDRDDWDRLERGSAERAAVDAIRRLEGLGVSVHTPAVDIADREALAALLHASGERPPIRGIVHAAGLFAPQRIADMSLPDFERVLEPKVAGTWLLHELTRDVELDFFVLFSSAASIWGSVLAGHYVAANHFQDLIAHHRRRLGLPAMAINWGWWAGSAMVAPEARSYFAAIGLEIIPEQLGLCALERLLMSGDAQRTVAPVDWRTFKPIYSARRPRPLLDLIRVAHEQGVAIGHEGAALLRRLASASHSRRCELVVEFLQPQVGAVLGRDPSQLLDPATGFFETGMDSIMSVQLKTRIERGLGIELATTAAFEHPNIASLARHIVDDVIELEPPPPEPAADPAAPADGRDGRHDANGSDGAITSIEALSEAALLDLLVAELGPGEGR